jgi:hypothetical protein
MCGCVEKMDRCFLFLTCYVRLRALESSVDILVLLLPFGLVFQGLALDLDEGVALR